MLAEGVAAHEGLLVLAVARFFLIFRCTRRAHELAIANSAPAMPPAAAMAPPSSKISGA